MISARDWQERAMDLEREGFEITVIGRQGRLEDEKTRALVRGAAAVRFTIDLQGARGQEGGAGISGDAVLALSKRVEEVIKKAAAHARTANREFITEKDVEEAWAELSGSR